MLPDLAEDHKRTDDKKHDDMQRSKKVIRYDYRIFVVRHEVSFWVRIADH